MGGFTALALALSLTGCSLFMTQNPKPLPSAPDCDGSPAPPIIDGVVGVVALFTSAGFGLASAIAHDDDTNNDRADNYATTAKVMLLTGLVELPVALVGGFRVGRCNNAHRAYERAQQQPYYPQPYPGQYPQQPYPGQPYPGQPYPPQPYPPQPYPQQPYAPAPAPSSPSPSPSPSPISPPHSN